MSWLCGEFTYADCVSQTGAFSVSRHAAFRSACPRCCLAERQRSCPLRSSLGRPDCAYKAGRKQGEVNSGQAVLRAVKQLAVWLKTTQSWNVNISEGLALHSALAASAAAWLDLGARSGWRRRFMCKETCWKSWFPNGVLFSRKNTY